MLTDITTYYLEMTEPSDLRPKRVSHGGLEVKQADVPLPEFNRFLYTAVGGDWYWVDRLSWTYHQWREWVDRPPKVNVINCVPVFEYLSHPLTHVVPTSSPQINLSVSCEDNLGVLNLAVRTLLPVTKFRSAGDDVVYSGSEGCFSSNEQTEPANFFDPSHSPYQLSRFSFGSILFRIGRGIDSFLPERRQNVTRRNGIHSHAVRTIRSSEPNGCEHERGIR